MTLLNILIGRSLDDIKLLLAYAGLFTAFWFVSIWFIKRKTDNSSKLAQKAVKYNQRHKRHSTEWTKQLGEDTQKENEYLVKTGFPEQNKRCGF